MDLSDSDDGGGGGNPGADVGGIGGRIGSNVSVSVTPNLGAHNVDRKKPIPFPDP